MTQKPRGKSPAGVLYKGGCNVYVQRPGRPKFKRSNATAAIAIASVAHVTIQMAAATVVTATVAGTVAVAALFTFFLGVLLFVLIHILVRHNDLL